MLLSRFDLEFALRVEVAVYLNLNEPLKMIAPIGIINACAPPQAALDAIDVGRIRDVTEQRGVAEATGRVDRVAGVRRGTNDAQPCQRKSVERRNVGWSGCSFCFTGACRISGLESG